jgi:glycosyltransferase involved in cell wall biosynthesis
VRIALVVPGGVDASGTHRVIPCLLWLIERLARDHDLRVFSLRQEARPRRYTLLGAPIVNIGRRGTIRRLASALVREHRRGPFDVLHVFWGGGHAAVVALVGRGLRVPVVLHLAGGELVSLPEIAYGGRLTLRRRATLRVAVRGAARITAACDSVVREGAALGIKVKRVALGVALDRWPLLAPRPRPPSAVPRLLHVGSLHPVKDQGTLLRAGALLHEWGVPFRLDIVGEDTLAGQVHRLARDLDLGGLVEFHGFLPHERLRPLFEAAHALIMASLHEGGEVVTREAAIAGIPAVGTAVGHIADLAPDAACAVPVGDAEALARAALTLITDDDRRVALAERAQEQAKREDADWTALRFGEIYRELIRERAR